MDATRVATVKNPKAIGESQWASRKSRMARLERSHETSRQGFPAATKQAFVEICRPKNGELGHKKLVTQKHLFWKKYRKHIYMYIYIYIHRILQSGVKLLPRKQKKHTQKRKETDILVLKFDIQTGLGIILWQHLSVKPWDLGPKPVVVSLANGPAAPEWVYWGVQTSAGGT